jgi:hypothetical protein
MKRIFLLLSLFWGLTACNFDSLSNEEFTAYEPVFMLRSVLDASIRYLPPTPMNETGKIYIYQDFLFVNAPGKGVHVVDNADPTDPKPLGFITIPGNYDIAIKSGMLYVDHATDLVALQIPVNGQSLKVMSRQANAFSEPLPPDGMPVPAKVVETRPKNSVIVRWQLKETQP